MPGRSWKDRAPCGTEAAYQRHRYEHRPVPLDDPCGCRAAHTAAEAERRNLAYAARVGVMPQQWAAMGADERDDVLWAARRRPRRPRDSAGRFARVAQPVEGAA